MNNNIPTAEEWLKQRCGHQTNHKEGENLYSSVMAFDLIEFAKLHVEAALKAASKKVTCKEEIQYDEQDNAVLIAKIDKDSILNAYPLTNIK